MERKNEFKRQISIVLGQKNQLWWDLPASESLYLNKRIYGIGDEEYRQTLNELCGLLQVENLLDVPVRTLSLGERMKLELIAALLHKPKVLFLDEPTSGLDPTNNRLMKDIILAEKKRGKTVIITTHNMFDATELCDQVAFIVAGKVSALDSPHNLIMSRGAAKIQYTYYDKGEKTGECLLDRTTEDKLLKNLISENRLLSIHSSEPTLNDIFVDITGRTLQ